MSFQYFMYVMVERILKDFEKRNLPKKKKNGIPWFKYIFFFKKIVPYLFFFQSEEYSIFYLLNFSTPHLGEEKKVFRSNIYETLHEFLLSAAGKELLRFSDLGFSEFCKFADNFTAEAHSSSSITLGTFAQEFIFCGVIGKLCLRLRLFMGDSI